jgi:hypothetical protein
MIRNHRHCGRRILALCLQRACGVAPAEFVGALTVCHGMNIEHQQRPQVTGDVFNA